jgi:hypothetical protein
MLFMAHSSPPLPKATEKSNPAPFSLTPGEHDSLFKLIEKGDISGFEAFLQSLNISLLRYLEKKIWMRPDKFPGIPQAEDRARVSPVAGLSWWEILGIKSYINKDGYSANDPQKKGREWKWVTPLFYAVICNNLPFLSWLCQQINQFSEQKRLAIINATNKLHLSLFENTPEGMWNSSALGWAVFINSYATVELLLSVQGVDAEFGFGVANQDRIYFTPLIFAIKNKNIAMMDLLYENGARVNTLSCLSVESFSYLDNLSFAARLGYILGKEYLEIVEYLLSRGASLSWWFKWNEKDYKSQPFYAHIFSRLKAADAKINSAVEQLDPECNSWDGCTISPAMEAAYLNGLPSTSVFKKMFNETLKLKQPFIKGNYFVFRGADEKRDPDFHPRLVLELTEKPEHQKIYAQKMIDGKLIYLVGHFPFDTRPMDQRIAHILAVTQVPPSAASDSASAAAGPAGPPSAAARSRSNSWDGSDSEDGDSCLSSEVHSSSKHAFGLAAPPSASASASLPMPPRPANAQIDWRISSSPLVPPPGPQPGAGTKLIDVGSEPVARPENLLRPPKGSAISDFNEGEVFNAVGDAEL